MSYRNPSPATKFPELVQRIWQGATSGIELTEFERRQIDRDARALIRSDPVSAYTVLGALAALRGDADDARTHHENALKLSSASMREFTNYSASLLILDMYEEAFELVLQALGRFPNNHELLDDAIERAVDAARFHRGLELCTQRKTLPPHEPSEHEYLIAAVVEALQESAFSEEAVRDALHLARDLLKESAVRSLHSTLLLDRTELYSFLYEIQIIATPDEAAELNHRYADHVVARSDLMKDPGLAFTPMFIGTQVDAGHSATVA